MRSVRIARNQIICLQNDLKKLIAQIDIGLGKYFNDVKDIPDSSSSKLPTQQMQNLTIQDPFLIVTLVDVNSPGHRSGIKTHDKVLEFGEFDCSNFESLAQIGELVKNSQNKEINVKVQRDGNQIVDLIITPQTWEGPGLLGFKVNAIPRD